MRTNTVPTRRMNWKHWIFRHLLPDLRAGAKVTWSVQAIHQMKGITITETGVLKPAKGGWKDAQCGLVMVTATAGEGEEAVSGKRAGVLPLCGCHQRSKRRVFAVCATGRPQEANTLGNTEAGRGNG